MMDWAEAAITEIITLGYNYNGFGTALHECLQVSRERGEANSLR